MFISGSEDIKEDRWSGERRGLGITQQISRAKKKKRKNAWNTRICKQTGSLGEQSHGRYIEMKLEARCQLYRALNAEFN